MRLPDGHIVIANSGTNEIRFYDASGSHLLDAGGEGEGPDEFRLVSWVSRYRGDSIAAYDMRLMRISVFDAEGQFGRSFPVRGMDTRGQSLRFTRGRDVRVQRWQHRSGPQPGVLWPSNVWKVD